MRAECPGSQVVEFTGFRLDIVPQSVYASGTTQSVTVQSPPKPRLTVRGTWPIAESSARYGYGPVRSVATLTRFEASQKQGRTIALDDLRVTWSTLYLINRPGQAWGDNLLPPRTDDALAVYSSFGLALEYPGAGTAFHRVGVEVTITTYYRFRNAAGPTPPPPQPPPQAPPPPLPTAPGFRVQGSGCHGDYEGVPGRVMCTAYTVNTPSDDPNTYTWYIDGRRAGGTGSQLFLEGVPPGEHPVRVEATNRGMAAEPLLTTVTVPPYTSPPGSGTAAPPTGTPTIQLTTPSGVRPVTPGARTPVQVGAGQKTALELKCEKLLYGLLLVSLAVERIRPSEFKLVNFAHGIFLAGVHANCQDVWERILKAQPGTPRASHEGRSRGAPGNAPPDALTSVSFDAGSFSLGGPCATGGDGAEPIAFAQQAEPFAEVRIELTEGPLELTPLDAELALDVVTPDAQVSSFGLNTFVVGYDPATRRTIIGTNIGSVEVRVGAAPAMPVNAGRYLVVTNSGGELSTERGTWPGSGEAPTAGGVPGGPSVGAPTAGARVAGPIAIPADRYEPTDIGVLLASGRPYIVRCEGSMSLWDGHPDGADAVFRFPDGHDGPAPPIPFGHLEFLQPMVRMRDSDRAPDGRSPGVQSGSRLRVRDRRRRTQAIRAGHRRRHVQGQSGRAALQRVRHSRRRYPEHERDAANDDSARRVPTGDLAVSADDHDIPTGHADLFAGHVTNGARAVPADHDSARDRSTSAAAVPALDARARDAGAARDLTTGWYDRTAEPAFNYGYTNDSRLGQHGRRTTRWRAATDVLPARRGRHLR